MRQLVAQACVTIAANPRQKNDDFQKQYLVTVALSPRRQTLILIEP